MNNNALRRRLLRAPLALPLAAVAGSILGSWAWCVVVGAPVIAMVLRLRRVALCAALCALVSGLHTELRARHAETLQALAESDTPVLVGTVERVMPRSLILRPQGAAMPAVYVYAETQAALGDVLRLRVVPEPPAEPPPVRGMFDREAWLRGLGVGAVCRAVSAEKIGHPWSWAALRGAGLRVRDRLASRLMPPEREHDARRQVLCALLLGAKDLAEPETVEQFRRGGCLHAFAVSGMHVGIILGICVGVFRLLRVRPAVSRLLIPVVVGVYILLTGCAVSALRAYLMGLMLWSGLTLRRRISPVNIWCAAACLLLVLRPYELYDAGFLLSFAVYAAICTGASLCIRRDEPWFGPDSYIPYRILTPWELRVKLAEAWVRGVVMVALCAWLASLPVTWACFHTVTPWAFVTNTAVAAPIMASMFSGLALLLCAGVPYLGAAAAWAADASAGALLAVVGFFGSLPGAYLPATLPQPADAVAVYELGYGKSCVVLGNPGVVIGAGNESQVRYTTAPALFHAGFRPAVSLGAGSTRAAEQGAALLQRQFPEMQLLSADTPACFTTRAGRFTIYPAPAEAPRTPAENRLPVILWEHGGVRTLYVGDASAAVLNTMPPAERHADVLILGAHPTFPLDDPEDIAALGVREVRLLPSAERRRAELPPAE